MEIYMIKKNSVFIPAYDSDREMANKINDGAILHCKIYKGHCNSTRQCLPWPGLC